ncbi:MAG: hypothetical protein FGM46_06005 [Ferruginibacter sp.]|nr:hypothetical protein [Ferruginibacter sp.]
MNGKILFLAVCTALLYFSCSDKKIKAPENAMETGTTFIRYILDGEFEDAKPLLLNDKENNEIFTRYKQYYERLNSNTKAQMKRPYNVNKFEELNDSVSILNYKNEIMNKPMDIKIIRKNNVWLIDFKYSYSGNLPIY